ncbi:hypothetical protein TNCV_167801 [Trichonephila clavipes]|nr:hypothetical protein TNCV_167801 [Trichonephila clavipes]
MTGQGDEFKFQAPYSSLPSSFLHMSESPLGRCIRPRLLHSGGCKPVGLPDQGLPQTPAEVTAAESVEMPKNWRRTSRGFLTWRFPTVRLNKQHERTDTPYEPSTNRIRRTQVWSGRATDESFMNRIESLMSQKADGKKTLKCWTCGREGHLQRSCRARQGAETNSASQKEVSEKLINSRLVGRRLPDFGKAPLKGVSNFDKRVLILQTLSFLGLDFLKEHGFTLDFNKNELRSIHEEITIFKLNTGQNLFDGNANEYITIPPGLEIIVPGYIGNDVSFNSGLIGSAENKANGLLIASTL